MSGSSSSCGEPVSRRGVSDFLETSPSGEGGHSSSKTGVSSTAEDKGGRQSRLKPRVLSRDRSVSMQTPRDHRVSLHRRNVREDGEEGEDETFDPRSAGLSSGLKSVTKGVAVGAASLFVLPTLGAKQEGIGGFFKGVGAGVLAAVALPLTGVAVAGYQLTRGIINTPEALHEKRQGKKWDAQERVWKENWYSLPEEAAEILNKENPHTSSSSTSAAPPPDPTAERKVVDTTYYDILEVPTDAKTEDIRRQYYKLARKYHPDKNPDDPQAKKRFQQIGEAYQVLGEDKRRAQYDQFGTSVAQDMPIIDSSLFFMMLFGSEALEPYIGKLKMAMFVEMVDGNRNLRGEDVSDEMFAFEQRKREVHLAVLLQQRLQPYVVCMLETGLSEEQRQEQIKEWETEMRKEAQALCGSSFGDAIIEAVSWTYENYACQFLGKLDTFLGLGGRYAKMQAQSRSVGNSCRTAVAGVRTAVAARQLQQRGQRKKLKNERNKKKRQQQQEREAAAAGAEGETGQSTNTDANAAGDDDGLTAEEVKQFEETLPLILETMLHICLMDVETTVRAAAKKVLKDRSVSIEVRRLRAEALFRLGRAMHAEAEAFKALHKDEKVDPVRRMEAAFIRAAQRADEERVKREGDHTGPPAPEHSPHAGFGSRSSGDFL